MKLYYKNCNQEEYVNYEANLNNKENTTTVIFFHGMWSSLESTKSQFLKSFCEKNNINYIIFDYFGHGKSSGKFDELTFEKALNSCIAIIDKLVVEKCIIVASSFGCWLATYIAIHYPNKIKNLMLIAPAIDFTSFLLKNHEGFDINNNGDLLRQTDNDYLIIRKLFLDSVDNYLLINDNKMINLNIPVCLLQGTVDTSIPYQFSIELMQKFLANELEMILVKNATHGFSSEFCLNLIGEKLLNYYKNL
jgi:pimeloyl-ACP methyl ester carboxylesterase